MANRCFQSHKQEERQITLLSHENAAKCVGSNIDLIWDREGGGYPPDYPAADNLSRRVMDVIPSIAAQCNDKNVLIVTHGDIVNTYLPELAPGLGIGAFAADVAGWAVLRNSTYSLDSLRILDNCPNAGRDGTFNIRAF